MDRGALAVAAVTGALLFLSLLAALLARSMVSSGYSDYEQPFMAWLPASNVAAGAIMLVASAAIAAGMYLFLSRFPNVAARLSALRARLLGLGFNRRDILRAAIPVLVLWVPILAAMYPAAIPVDTLNQLYQYTATTPTYYPSTADYIDAEFVDHHPVLDTLLYGFFWSIGDALGNQDAGLFMLVALQAVVLAGECAAMACYLERLRVPWALRAASLAFFAWFPMFGHYAATILKDVTYLMAFIPWLLMWAEAIRTRGRALESTRFLAAFMVLGGLCIVTKKLGLYILLPSLAVLVAAMRGQRLRLVLSSAATLAVFCALVPALVYPAIGGVAPGGKQEMLGPAIQHVTAAVRADASTFTESEMADLEKVFDVQRAVKRYEPYRTDRAKGTFKRTATDADIARFLQLWAAGLTRQPLAYATSTATTTGMLYIPYLRFTYYADEDLESRMAFYRSLDTGFAVDYRRPAQLVELNAYLDGASPERAISDLPGISLLFTVGFYGGWIPVLVLAAMAYASRASRAAGRGRERFLWLGVVPMAFTFAFFLVCPVASPRYVLPFLYSTPLLLGWAWLFLARARGAASRPA